MINEFFNITSLAYLIEIPLPLVLAVFIDCESIYLYHYL